MLIRFRVANFRSLRDEQDFSMVAAFQDGRTELVPVESLGLDLLRVAGIYGANAAGKSNLFDALRFMRSAVIGSHRHWPPDGPIPREPFLLDAESPARPSLFEVTFLLDGSHFQYGFELDSETILREWLYSFPNRRRQILFTREAAGPEPFHFGKGLKGSNRTLQKLTRANSLFLSVAAENAHESLSRVYSWFTQRLSLREAATQERWLLATARLLETKHDEVLNLVRLADLGIVDVELKESSVSKDRGRNFSSSRGEGANKILEFRHQSSGEPVSLSLGEQSRGTQAWFALAGAIIEALANGALLCLDEIDASLHPLLTSELIRIFQDPDRNPGRAQLVFNSHDTTLLGSLLEEPVLGRDQIWFVEKDADGASHLYPLTDFKPRKFENVERGYLQGRYGAVPFTDPSEAA